MNLSPHHDIRSCNNSTTYFNSSLPHQHHCHSPTADTILGVIVTLIGVWTIIANIIVITSFWGVKTKFGPIFVNIAASDAIVGVLLGYFGVFLVLDRRYPEGDVVSKAVCYVFGWSFNVLSVLTPLLTALLGSIRSLSVYKAVWINNNLRYRHVQWTAVVLWLYAGLAASSLGFRGGNISYIPRRAFCDYTSYGAYSEEAAQLLVCVLMAIPTLLCTLIVGCTIVLLTIKLVGYGVKSRRKKVLIVANIMFSVVFIVSYCFVDFIYIGIVFVKGYVNQLVKELFPDELTQTYIQMCYYYITCLCSTINPIVHFISNAHVRSWISSKSSKFRSLKAVNLKIMGSSRSKYTKPSCESESQETSKMLKSSL